MERYFALKTSFLIFRGPKNSVKKKKKNTCIPNSQNSSNPQLTLEPEIKFLI